MCISTPDDKSMSISGGPLADNWRRAGSGSDRNHIQNTKLIVLIYILCLFTRDNIVFNSPSIPVVPHRFVACNLLVASSPSKQLSPYKIVKYLCFCLSLHHHIFLINLQSCGFKKKKAYLGPLNLFGIVHISFINSCQIEFFKCNNFLLWIPVGNTTVHFHFTRHRNQILGILSSINIQSSWIWIGIRQAPQIPLQGTILKSLVLEFLSFKHSVVSLYA